MGLSSAMLVGFTGIKSNQVSMDTIGDNVANVNTTAFKNQRTLFETALYRTLRDGSAPDDPFGGTNPYQIGYGSTVASVQRSFVQGSIQPTGLPSDLAIQGEGFFAIDAPNGDRVFTRDGAFSLNEENNLVTLAGGYVLGFAADSDGTVVPGPLSRLTIPLGIEAEARPTTAVTLDGNLDAGVSPATTAGTVTSAAFSTATGPANAGTALTALLDSNGQPLLAAGDVITLDGAQKGGLDLPGASFTVGSDGTTLGDLAGFLYDALGIQDDSAEGGTAGVTIGDGTDAPSGSLQITSNLGQVNAISLDSSSLRNETSGALLTAFTSTPADGEGTTTGFVVFDSLGNTVEIRLRAFMQSQDASGTVWRYHAESADGGTLASLGGGTITFDQNGQFLSATGTTLTLDRSAVGAVSPMTVELDLSQVNGLVDASGDSVLVMSTQNGAPAGSLIAYGIDQDGIIEGTFTNGSTQVLGQVALATFANPQGLVAIAGNNFVVGANSGDPAIQAPNTVGAGGIEAGALEASNVDLSREFIGLITASTGFSAASRVVRTADELLQELLLLAR